jgi:3D (Asp-Asp-Asp) domain-containing protein
MDYSLTEIPTLEVVCGIARIIFFVCAIHWCRTNYGKGAINKATFWAVILILLAICDMHAMFKNVLKTADNQEVVKTVYKKESVDTFQAKVTAYCPCSKCCGKDADGVTSKGVDANLPGIAADPKRVPYGTVLNVPGYGSAVVDDTGGAMRRSTVVHLDVRFKTHQEALNWGVKELAVEIVRDE